MKRKIGLLFVTLMTSLLALVNVKVEAKPEVSPAPQTLEVKDVLEEGAIEGSGRVVRRVASPAANHKASQAYMQVTAPTADGKVNVRFVAGIDSAEYAEAQLKLEMFDGETSKGSYTAKVTTAYTAMVIPGAEEPQTAAQVFGEGYNYIVAYTMKNMPRESWENGFKASVGLKLAGEETFTETAAEEVKNVKAAIMADNHLVFSWRPWSDIATNATVVWENDFLIDVVAPDIKIENFEPTYKEDGVTVDKTAEQNYTAAINAIVKEKIHAEVTMEDGTVHHSTSAAAHAVRADRGKQIVLTIPNVNLKDNTYSVKVYIELPNGSQVVGVREYTKLDEVKNAKVEQNESGDYVLTFDEVENANSYSYKIFADGYEGNELIANPNGTILPVTTLASGTYGIYLKATSEYYAKSEASFEEVFSIVNETVIRDARNYFEIKMWNKNKVSDFVVGIKPFHQNQKVTKTGMVSELAALNIENKSCLDGTGMKKYTDLSIKVPQADSSFDEESGYYVFCLNTNTLDVYLSYQLYFVLETDAGEIFTFYVMFRDLHEEGEVELEVTHMRDVLSTNGINFGLTAECYSADNWKKVTDLYDPVGVALSDETYSTKDLYDLYTANIAEARKISLDNTEKVSADVKKKWVVSTDSVGNFATNATVTDGNYGNGWQISKFADSVTERYFLIELDQNYDVAAMYLKWDKANAVNYEIYVSSDGNSWSETPNAEYYFTSIRSAKEEVFSLNSAKNIKFIKIKLNKPNSGYGPRLMEIDVYLSK